MTQDDLSINSARHQIMSGLLKALKNADIIDAILKKRDSAKKILTEKFGFSSMQAQSLLDLRKPLNEIDESKILQEITELERIKSELKEKKS